MLLALDSIVRAPDQVREQPDTASQRKQDREEKKYIKINDSIRGSQNRERIREHDREGEPGTQPEADRYRPGGQSATAERSAEGHDEYHKQDDFA